MKLFIFVIACLGSYSTWACLESQEASFLFIPEPIWILDSPKESKAVVEAQIDIDATGRVKIKKIINASPKGIPLDPLKEAIEKARFLPAKFKASSSNTWVKGASTINYKFELTW